ncbi:MAG TPA: heavy-metal-associated domain-containing protein [Prolixibacteraceae bacterium]|jgi:copper chaperone CopZ
MKTVKIIIIAFLAIALGSNSYAQMHDHSKMTNTKTEMLKVSGNCETCKARIEKAAKVEGVTTADWSVKTKTLSVTYDPAKTNMEVIGKKVAAVGHDNGKMKADDKIYTSLPGCCKYR